MAAQSGYVGAGVGPTAVVEGPGSGNRNIYGVLGWQWQGQFGLRLEGAETVSRLWLSADLTYRFNGAAAPVRPYGLAGGGLVFDLSEGDALLTVGAGIRVQVHRLLFMFAELRLQPVVTPTPQPQVILPLTFGLGVGS